MSAVIKHSSFISEWWRGAARGAGNHQARSMVRDETFKGGWSKSVEEFKKKAGAVESKS